jgi:hypothetical protein
MYKPIRPGAIVARQYRLFIRTPVHTLLRAPSKQDLQLTMRLIARFVVLMVAVFGVSLAFAWAWDKSDKPQDAATAHAS